MWSALDEAKKHRAFREAWVGYILSGIFLLISFYQSRTIASFYRWYVVQQDRIYTALEAF